MGESEDRIIPTPVTNARKGGEIIPLVVSNENRGRLLVDAHITNAQAVDRIVHTVTVNTAHQIWQYTVSTVVDLTKLDTFGADKWEAVGTFADGRVLFKRPK